MVGPDLQAELGLWGIFKNHHQIKVESPGDGGGKGDDPDDEYHEPGAALGDLALERPPDGQESANKDKIKNINFCKRFPTYHFGTIMANTFITDNNIQVTIKTAVTYCAVGIL